jgi:hypothetical protein
MVTADMPPSFSNSRAAARIFLRIAGSRGRPLADFYVTMLDGYFLLRYDT